MTRALLLNASYEPHAILRDRDAVTMYLTDVVDVIEYSGEEFHSPSITVLVPSVIRLRKYIVMPEKHRSVLLTTRAVLARDNYECAYCGRTGLTSQDGTLDHIEPRSLGGKHVWTNAIAACRRCNQKKGAKTLDQLGWVLRFQPYRPQGIAAYFMTMVGECPTEWVPYLQAA